ncbi:CBS domain-containing protein [Candidatus Nitronereus thalassa]|uniref:CBS domain-containing protein n=1 Tax=Candidatus Nitronereus thalassa TaxID=3020898 RepID=A0ABU3K7M8_9BACT|nr:CBS domain-containing protein [Candidatus Nitronereus thalassa]MDT7042380.1 CBS domain-containing protein [Candidatus Nitronereus thalassa]
MPTQGISVALAKTVGQIVPTNLVKFREDQSGMAIATELLTHYMPGGVVVNESDELMGFISEFDLIKALDEGKDLHTLTAKNLMVTDRISIEDSASIQEAINVMKHHRLLNLPVEHNGKVVYTITRHDLLRAWIGAGNRKKGGT